MLGHNPTSRPYEQIIAESNAPGSNFIIQIKLVKVENSSFPDHKPMNLTTPQIGDLIFKTLNIHHSSILEVDLITGRYDTRELLLRADTDLSKALTTLTPHLYNDHKVTVTLISNQASRSPLREFQSVSLMKNSFTSAHCMGK